MSIVERPPTRLAGLSSAEAQRRFMAGDGNVTSTRHGRSVRQIVRANVITRFNAILGALVVIIVTLGSVVDGLFAIVIVVNVLIGVVQEIRSQQTLDRLLLITAPTAVVLRDEEETEVRTVDVVRGDLVGLRAGAQVVVDGTLEVGDGIEIDESLVSGESDPQRKSVGDQLRSGSFVATGTGWLRAGKVGEQSFANTLARQARDVAVRRSELSEATDVILRIVTWAIVPIAAALFIGQRLGGDTLKNSVFAAASGVVEIVPEGFVLLTSMTLAISVIRLGRSNVLVKELAAVEGLARVDTVCFDKTGTLTTGKPFVDRIITLGRDPDAYIRGALFALTATNENATSRAIQERVRSGSFVRFHVESRIPFSSERKWSAAVTSTASTIGRSVWVLGAPDVLIPDFSAPGVFGREVVEDAPDSLRALAGKRSLMLAVSVDEASVDNAMVQTATTQTARADDVNVLQHGAGREPLGVVEPAPNPPSLSNPPSLPKRLRPVALIVLTEDVRKDARQSLRYFAEESVDAKVISGDNAQTVAAVAEMVGLPNLRRPGAVVDARTLSDESGLIEAIRNASVIGRTTPQQKQSIIAALRADGHTVAMTGDGVNDVLALKTADLGIAMGSGSDASRAVADVVLIDGNFSALAGVVAEGRRVIANVERVAKLFLTKTVYAAALAIASGIAELPFPFLPRQLTLITTLTIGVPGFFLAFASNEPKATHGFLRRSLVFALPAGLVSAVGTFAAYSIALKRDGVSVAQARTASTLTLGLIGFWIVAVLARPLTKGRDALLGTIFGMAIFSGLSPTMRKFWALKPPGVLVLAEAVVVATLAIACIEGGWRLVTTSRKRDQRTNTDKKTDNRTNKKTNTHKRVKHYEKGAAMPSSEHYDKYKYNDYRHCDGEDFNDARMLARRTAGPIGVMPL